MLFSSVATPLLPMNVLPNSTARRVLMYVIYTTPLKQLFFSFLFSSSPAGGFRLIDSTNAPTNPLHPGMRLNERKHVQGKGIG